MAESVAEQFASPIPALAGLGAALLTAVMIGAVATHVYSAQPADGAALLLVAMAIVAWDRRTQIRKIFYR